MTNSLQIVALFFAELGLGSAIVFPFMPVKVTGKSFLRFYYGLILAFLGLFTFCLWRLGELHQNYLFTLALGAWIWGLSFTREFTRLEESLLWIFSVFALALFAIYTQKYFLHDGGWGQTISRLGIFTVAALFLSLHLMNMIFGHWYLVNRNLPIIHLIKTSRLLMAISYLRLISVGLAVTLAHDGMDTEAFARLTDFMGHGIFFWARLLAGVGLPLLVSHLAYASAKIGSNQSATGIMYAGVVFVIMGEIMALYLYSITGFPF
jgi:hypothetical protein